MMDVVTQLIITDSIGSFQKLTTPTVNAFRRFGILDFTRLHGNDGRFLTLIFALVAVFFWLVFHHFNIN